MEYLKTLTEAICIGIITNIAGYSVMIDGEFMAKNIVMVASVAILWNCRK